MTRCGCPGSRCTTRPRPLAAMRRRSRELHSGSRADCSSDERLFTCVAVCLAVCGVNKRTEAAFCVELGGSRRHCQKDLTSMFLGSCSASAHLPGL